MSERAQTTVSSSAGWLKRILPLAIVAGLIALTISQGWHTSLIIAIAENLQSLQAFVAEHRVAAILAYMTLYAVVVTLSLPIASILTPIGAMLIGWLVGGLATVVAATLGATAIFLIAKTSLGEALAARAGPWLGKLRDGFQENALSYLLFLRLVPAFPFWLVNLAPALLGVKLRDYVIGTFFGIIPGTFAYSYAGKGFESVIVAAYGDYEACVTANGADNCTLSLDLTTLVTRDLVIAIAALGVVALIPVIIKKLRAHRRAA
ncbi:MAG: TVP38/TMEM64 family protein [Hyphomicrobiaceae bacterium]